LAENNRTSLFQVKEGADCQKLSIIELTQDRMTIFGHDDDDGQRSTESRSFTFGRNRNRKSIVSGPKPSASLCQPVRAHRSWWWPDADVDSAASFSSYLYIVSQYTVKLMTPCVWRILCLRNSSSVPYFRQPPNLPTAARRNRKCTKCGTTAVTPSA